jgi:hypothetical protein
VCSKDLVTAMRANDPPPVTVRLHDDGTATIRDNCHRVHASEAVGYSCVPIRIEIVDVSRERSAALLKQIADEVAELTDAKKNS